MLVFESAEAAAAAFDREANGLVCFADLTKDGRGNTPSLLYADAATEPVMVDKALGDDTAGVRLTMRVARASDQRWVSMTIDGWYVRKGRMIFALFASSLDAPLDEREMGMLAKLAAANLQRGP